MDSGVAYAKQFQLAPGVALSEQQMAQLTTDIVWLQEETVTMPDGSTTKALVPQVYLRRPQQGDLSTGGALIAGDNVTIRNQNGSISNSGTILAGYANAKPTDMHGTVTLDARNVSNRGTIAGNVVDIKAANDIANVGGRIAGLSNKGVDGSATDDSRVTLNAGRDILVASTTRTRSVDTVGNNGTSTSSRTNIDRVATIAGGNVLIDARGNFTARAAQVDAAANLSVLAGKNIDIAGVEEKHALFVPLGGNTMGRTGYTNEASVSNVGSDLTAGNNVTIKAGGDATLSGSRIAAANDASISGTNVTISAVKDRKLVDVQTVGRKQYDCAMTDDETLSGGSVSAGNNVTISATGIATGQKDKDGKAIAQVGTGNLVLNAAKVTALKGTASLLANNDVSIQTVTTGHDSLNDSYSKSGNLVKSTTTTTSSTANTQQAEGSRIAGNSIAIVAGNGKDLVGNVQRDRLVGACRYQAGRHCRRRHQCAGRNQHRHLQPGEHGQAVGPLRRQEWRGVQRRIVDREIARRRQLRHPGRDGQRARQHWRQCDPKRRQERHHRRQRPDRRTPGNRHHPAEREHRYLGAEHRHHSGAGPAPRNAVARHDVEELHRGRGRHPGRYPAQPEEDQGRQEQVRPCQRHALRTGRQQPDRAASGGNVRQEPDQLSLATTCATAAGTI